MKSNGILRRQKRRQKYELIWYDLFSNDVEWLDFESIELPQWDYDDLVEQLKCVIFFFFHK